jgi:hypothetical protein
LRCEEIKAILSKHNVGREGKGSAPPFETTVCLLWNQPQYSRPVPMLSLNTEFSLSQLSCCISNATDPLFEEKCVILKCFLLTSHYIKE